MLQIRLALSMLLCASALHASECVQHIPVAVVRAADSLRELESLANERQEPAARVERAPTHSRHMTPDVAFLHAQSVDDDDLLVGPLSAATVAFPMQTLHGVKQVDDPHLRALQMQLERPPRV